MKKYETFLPVFPGFYGTIFESEEEAEIDRINEDRSDARLEKIDDGSIEFDEDGYRRAIAAKCCNFLSKKLQELNLAQEIFFQAISSPREYNFANDSINISVGLTVKNRKAIQAYVLGHRKEFQEFLKGRYTACSGFIPRYSNLLLDWSDETGKFYKFENPGHYLGAVLEFICECEEITEEDMYEACSDIYLEAEDYDYEISKQRCAKCGQWYSLSREYSKQVARDTELYGKKFVPIAFDLWAKKQENFKHCENEV